MRYTMSLHDALDAVLHARRQAGPTTFLGELEKLETLGGEAKTIVRNSSSRGGMQRAGEPLLRVGGVEVALGLTVASRNQKQKHCPMAPSPACTPSSSASGTPPSASTNGGRSRPERGGVSLLRIAESLGRVGSKGGAAHVNSGDARAAPARHRQLNFDVDSIADGDREENNGGEHDDALEATQALPEDPEEEEVALPEDSQRDRPFDSQTTESSSEDDPADETFVPESEENTEEATETVSDESADDAPPVKSRSRGRGRTRAAPPPSRPSARRRTVRWTQEEVDFLRNSVRERGLGSWKKVLLDGREIFDSHRTNVDLKDKWMNLVKRFGEDAVLGETEIDVTAQARVATPQGTSIRGAEASSSTEKRKRRGSTDRDESSDASVRPSKARARQQVPANGNTDSNVGADAGFSPSTDDVDAESNSWMTLKIMTDESFPESVSATVNLAKCVDVRTLKRRIRNKVLPKISPGAEVPEHIQLISTDSRKLLGNNELLRRCLRDGETKLYVIPGSP